MGRSNGNSTNLTLLSTKNASASEGGDAARCYYFLETGSALDANAARSNKRLVRLNDEAVPEVFRREAQEWGWCRDEFTDTNYLPPQLYVREARRMISDYVMTERNCRGEEVVPDAIGLAAYQMDSHNCQRFVQDGHVRNEGDVQTGNVPPYPISFRALVPKKVQCENLIVPVCLSASHIAYGSIRMEPVFMTLGQSAATIAAMAMDQKSAVQDVPYEALKARLLHDKQVLIGAGTIENH